MKLKKLNRDFGLFSKVNSDLGDKDIFLATAEAWLTGRITAKCKPGSPLNNHLGDEGANLP